MFGWFKRKPIEPVVVEPEVRPETAEERQARWNQHRAECEARIEKLDALDRRGERLTKDTRVVWWAGDEAIITDTHPLGPNKALLFVGRNNGSTTWTVGSGDVVKLPDPFYRNVKLPGLKDFNA